MVSTKVQKVLAIITITASVAGLSLSGKPSIFFLWLGSTTGGIYLVASPKPWNQQQRWKNTVSLMRGKISHTRKLVKYNLSIEEMEAKLLRSQQEASHIVNQANLTALTVRAEAQSYAEDRARESTTGLEQLEKIKKQLTLEVNDLKKLAAEITNETEYKALQSAVKIKEDAEAEASRIIEATKSNLQNTVFEPERNAHLQLLSQLTYSPP